MKKYFKLLIGLLIILAFIVWTILVKTVDVREIGHTTVGLSHMNETFMNLLHFNETLFKITDYLMFSVIGAAVVFAGMGVYQWFKRKSIKLVDKEIFILGISYVIVIALYFLFDKAIVINNRPVLIDGVDEPSYPSSHTMTALFVFLSAIPMVNYLLKNKKAAHIIINVCLIVLSVFTVGGRILSGAHWMSDIVGGVLVAIGLLYVFLFFIERVQTVEEVKTEE